MRNLLYAVRRDIARYNRAGRPSLLAAVGAAYSHPAFVGLLHYRLGRYCWIGKRNPVKFLLLLLIRGLYPLIRLYSGVEISPKVTLGPGAYLGHFGPIVIHPDVVSGEQVTLMQGVTLGETRGGVPRIGSFVSVGAGATVVGPVAVGDWAVVAAGAVVVEDVRECTVVGGVPARPIGERTREGYDEPSA